MKALFEEDAQEPQFSATKLVDVSEAVKNSPALVGRLKARTMSKEEWVANDYGSGTLKKGKKVGLRFVNHYLKERICFEFGWGFEVLPASRVRWGDGFTEGDCSPITETIWHATRLLTLWPYPEDEFEVKSIEATYEDKKTKTGLGFIVRKTSAKWVGNDKMIFAIVAEWDPIREDYLPAENPF